MFYHGKRVWWACIDYIIIFIIFQARQVLESEYTTLLRDGTDRQQLGVPTMESNGSSPSWDEAPRNSYECSIVAYVSEECTNTPSEGKDKETSFAEESDASSVIAKPVKRKPKYSSKISKEIS